MEVLRMTLNDDSLLTMKAVLEQDLGCEGINEKTVFAMRLKLIHAMASIEPPKLTGVIQMDETFIRESQKGRNLELVSYVKGIERVPRYGRKPSNYTKILEHAGYLYADSGIPAGERKAHNQALLERLYNQGEIDCIEHREDLSYSAFRGIKKTYKLSLARVNEVHAEIKLMIEKKMTNVATKYLPDYMGFFAFRRNWKVVHKRSPANRQDAEQIFKQLLLQKVTLTRPELEQVRLDLPKPSGRAAQILKEKTETARKLTKNKYFKYDAEDLPSFNTREILLDAPRVRLTEIARDHKIKGYTKMTQWSLAAAIAKLPDVDEIIMDLVTRDRRYMIDEEDIKYLQSIQFRAQD